MPVSIQDVAKKAGVTIGTVSRAFNNYSDIKTETKQRIMQAAAELGYKPNVAARNLSAKQSSNIALIVSGLLEGNTKDNLVYLLLQGVVQYTTQHGLELALYTTDSEEQHRLSYTDFCTQHSIAGTILSGIKTDDAYCTELLDSGIPSVLIDQKIVSPSVSWVSIDNQLGAKEAIDYLLRTGHRNLLVVAGRKNADVTQFRAEGVKAALRDATSKVVNVSTYYCDFDEEVAYRKTLEHLRTTAIKPDAIFCFSDIMALGAMKAVRDCGLRIPEDVSVIGFDGLLLCELTVPNLSTVEQDMRAIGYAAAKELHEMMEHEHEGRHVVLSHKLTIRDSVCDRK